MVANLDLFPFSFPLSSNLPLFSLSWVSLPSFFSPANHISVFGEVKKPSSLNPLSIHRKNLEYHFVSKCVVLIHGLFHQSL